MCSSNLGGTNQVHVRYKHESTRVNTKSRILALKVERSKFTVSDRESGIWNWAVLVILGLPYNLHNRGNVVLQVSDVVAILECGHGSSLHNVLVDTNKGHNVATSHILNLLGGTAHHQDGWLNVLHVEAPRAARFVV